MVVLIGPTGSCDNASHKGKRWDEGAKEAMGHRFSIERDSSLEVSMMVEMEKGALEALTVNTSEWKSVTSLASGRDLGVEMISGISCVRVWASVSIGSSTTVAGTALSISKLQVPQTESLSGLGHLPEVPGFSLTRLHPVPDPDSGEEEMECSGWLL